VTPPAPALFCTSKSNSGSHDHDLIHTTANMAPSFDNLDNEENFDDVEIDYSGTPPRKKEPDTDARALRRNKDIV
jgi:hypothetical protein